MTRPASTPTWATTGGTRLEPDAGEKASGHVAGTRPPARKLNWLQGIIADWVGYFAGIIDANDEHTYPTPKERVVVVGPREGNGEPGWTYNAIDRATCSTDSHDLFIDIGRHLPTGATLTKVEALVKPGAARVPGGTACMKLYVYRSALGAAFTTPGDPTDTALGTADEDDGTNGYQRLDVGALTEVVDRTANNLVAWLHAGDTATANSDLFFGLRLTYTDIGPRNA